MKFIQKYMALIIPGVLILAALALIGISFMVNSGVKKNMKESVALSKSVTSQIKKTPSQRQAKVEEEYQNKHESDAKRIEAIVKNCSYRELISYKVFPKPRDTSRQVFKNFGSAYRDAINSIVAKMNASDAPSQKELDAEKNVTSSRRNSRRSTAKDEVDPIIDALCKKRASQASVYAAPDLFDWYHLWDDYEFIGQTDAIKDCWYSQVAFWVYEDIVDTIVTINNESESVFDSPVKRLVGISFTQQADSLTKSDSKSSTLDTPAYITEELPPILGAEAWTTREGGEENDVIHFSVSFIVAADQVPKLMKTLCGEKGHVFKGWNGKDSQKVFKHNQISILNIKVTPVVRDDTENQYYRYGESAVVQLTTVCEYVFMRAAYDKIKPDSIKELLMQEDG